VFTAALELRGGRELSVSFLHHLALQRNVYNPAESRDVVGITNYLDLGFRLTADLLVGSGAPPAGGAGGGAGTMQLAAAWQANKNVQVKGRLGMDGVAAALVLKSWWQPSLTLGVAATHDLRGGAPRLGLTAAVESFRELRSVPRCILPPQRVLLASGLSPLPLPLHFGFARGLCAGWGAGPPSFCARASLLFPLLPPPRPAPPRPATHIPPPPPPPPASRYERSAAGLKMAGARVTQRHVADADDVAYHRGQGLLVPLEDVDSQEVLGQQPRAGDDCL
jgi:hypothetical protein